MGYMRHHTIVVASCNDNLLEEAHERAKALFPWISEISVGGINLVRAFFVPPDGSKEGWGESEEGDERRKTFVDWLDAQRYADNSNSLEWVEVQFGDDECVTKIIRDSDEHLRMSLERV